MSNRRTPQCLRGRQECRMQKARTSIMTVGTSSVLHSLFVCSKFHCSSVRNSYYLANMKLNKIAALVTVVMIVVSCNKKVDNITTPPPPPPPPVTISDNDPINLGNPTNAVTSTSYPENYLKDNTYYKLAYSLSRSIPVWVAWHLQSEDIGSTPRQDDFRADTGLPTAWYQVQNTSYSGSGFDRGHNCPSADRTTTVAANSSTFLMTNMIPQAPMLNQGPWAALEDYIRTLVGSSKEAYIVMGNYGVGGYNSSGFLYGAIDAGHVKVPSQVWKVALLIPKGNSDLTRIDTSATILAVNMPNDDRLYNTSSSGQNAWRNYITTVSSLETAANSNGVPLNLFTNISSTISVYLKGKRYQ